MANCPTPNTRSTCRAGYTCFSVGTGGICYPDCAATGCGAGKTCNSTTGHCQ